MIVNESFLYILSIFSAVGHIESVAS